MLPMGSDQTQTRYPRLTITIIIVCSALYPLTFWAQAIASIKFMPAATEFQSVNDDLMARYLQDQGVQNPNDMLFKLQFNPLKYRYLETQFRQAMEDGKVVPKDSPDYRRWTEARENFRQARMSDVYYLFGYVPSDPGPVSLITHMFLHGSFWHLFFNMYFLWLVGISLEDVWGRKYFAGIFLAGGIIGALSHHVMSILPDSPLIGASGAIAALMGAYTIRFFHARLHFWFFKWDFWLRAWIPLLFWFGREVYHTLGSLGELMGVATWVHVGGFVFGASAALVLKRMNAEGTFIQAALKEQDHKDELAAKAKAEKKAPPPGRSEELTQGIEARKLEKFDEAEALLRAAIAKQPQGLEAREELIRLLFRLNKTPELAIEIAGMAAVLLAARAVEPALQWYGELLKLGPPHATAGAGPWLVKVGQELQRRGGFEPAATAYLNFAGACPEDPLAPKAIFAGALIYLDKLGRPTDAQAILGLLLSRYPNWMPVEVREARERTEKKINP